jgi:hypothetical protein
MATHRYTLTEAFIYYKNLYEYTSKETRAYQANKNKYDYYPDYPLAAAKSDSTASH